MDEQLIFKGLFEGADLKGTQINFVTGEHAKVVYQEGGKQEENAHFPLNKTKDEGIDAYNFLIKDQYISNETPLDSFLFLLGYVEQKPEQITSIMWTGTKEQLRTMLRLLFKKQIDNKHMKVVDLEELAPKVFVNRQNSPMTLAKPTKEYSNRIDELENFFRPK